MPRPLRLLTLATLAVAMGACGDTGESGPPTTVGCTTAEDGRVTLVAADIRWDTDCLQAEPGPLTIVVDNRDTRVNHNLHLPTAPGSPATDLEQGPVVQELEVTLTAGTYEYVCDIHSNMVGTLTVG